MNTGNNDSYRKEIERALKKIASMVLLLSLTACTGQNPSADLSGNHEDAAQQEESAEGSFADEGVPPEETVSSGSYPYDSVFPQHEPYGEGIGAMPGRVVWVYDTDSVLWDGNSYWWKPENFEEKAIQDMVNDSIASLGGEETAKDGWNALFLAHNIARDKGSTGYIAREKIVIKGN